MINFRGCGSFLYDSVTVSQLFEGAGVPITSPQLYSAGHTDDLRTALMYIAQRFSGAPLLGLGFSLGANVMTRYIAEEGDHSRLHSSCALACVSAYLIITYMVRY